MTLIRYKAFLWGKIITFYSYYKKNASRQYKLASEHLRLSSPSRIPPSIERAGTKPSNSDLWAETQECLHQTYMDLQYYKYGKAGKLLARLCKPAHILELDNITSSSSEINKILELFYGTLNAQDLIDLQTANNFLDQVPLPKIDPTLVHGHLRKDIDQVCSHIPI